MLNNVVSIGNVTVARMLAGMLTMCLDHPVVLCLIVSGLAGSGCAVLLGVIVLRTGMGSERSV